MDAHGGLKIWTPRRLELLAWLRRNALPLAEIYEGAVHLVYETPPVPGRVWFVAHAVREIRNRLPDFLLGPRGGSQLQYKNRVDDLAKVWKRTGLSTDGSLPVAVSSGVGMPPGTPDVPIDRRVFLEIAGLVRDHLQTRETRRESAMRLFEGIAPENRELRDALTPVVDHWLTATEWFVERVHVSERTDAECGAAELAGRFELVETSLMALVGAFFGTLKELDEILEDANS